MRLKEYLVHQGIKYKDFARRVGISKSTLWNILWRGNCMLDTALTIEKETNGAVKCKDLLLIEKKIKDKSGPKKCQTLDAPHDDIVDQEQGSGTGDSDEKRTA